MQARSFPTSRARSSSTSSRSRARLSSSATLTAAFLFLSGCGLVPVEETVGAIFQKPVSVASAPPALAHLRDEPEPYRWPDYTHADGKVSRTMWLAPGSGKLLEDVLIRAPEWLAVERTVTKAPVIVDPNADSKAPWPAWATRAGLETVILRGTLEQVDAASRLVEAILSSVPQILIEARVVEVVESDEFGLGIDWFLLEHDDHGPLDPTLGPLQPLDPTKTVFDRGLLGSGIPPLPGIVRSGLLPNALVELGTIKDGLQVDLLISALSQLTKIDVVNAPNVAVRAGHIATISAGEDVPYFTVQVSGSNQTVSTKFKKVAVNLAVLPTLTAPDRLSLAVHLSVENVTGVSTVETGGATTSNPIISSRVVTTTMDCKDGATVVLGGLIQTRDISVDEKVPLLGDIPIMGHLFSSTHSQEARSNLLFFLRPKIINPTSGKDTEVILPPRDDELIPGNNGSVITPPKPGEGKGEEGGGSTGTDK